ncbi:hypothetical protein [Spongiimicrobium sp. 3-5]|uniref:hypothetical protein n=1 Tax=Spongiimicrobium sp. 3-5 TaxID=3332596 RepID=UPI0039816D8C
MKKVVLVVMLCVGVTALAQKEKGREHHRNAFKDMSPEQVATLHTKKMTLALDLNETQQQQIQQLNLENAISRKAKIEERKALKEKNENQKPTTDERFEMLNLRLDDKIAHQQKVKQILSEKQYDQWKRMQHKKGMRHKGLKKQHGRK